ncbi:MAG: HAMP domain-containing histidine kinase [Candidatus Vogelbacteria bacterium]|nr:HAMP domain-containing histidine kinase [Candidatus Vogelbacteria bacterium]
MQFDIASLIIGVIVGMAAIYLYQKQQNKVVSKNSLTIEAIIHELKTPLTGLSWIFASLSGLNVGDLLGNETIELLKEGKNKIGNALELANDALFALNTSSNYVTYKFEPNNLTTVINKVIEENSLGAKEKNISVLFNQDGYVPPFKFDEIKITLAIRNLINNAIKYTPQNGGVTVATTTDNNTAIITVTDTGIGIPQADKSKVFNKFFRSKNVENVPGSGLGLFIVKNIVTGHSGAIDIQSNEGKGTKVTINLPLKK